MTKTNGNKILLGIIAALILTNLLVIALWWNAAHTDKMPPKRTSPMTEYLKNDLGFSNIQMAKFDTIKMQQRSDAKKLFGDIRNEKATTYKNLAAGNFSDSALNIAADFSSQKQKNLEMMMLMHLRDIRNLCTPDQMKKFDTGFYKVMTHGGSRDDGKKK